MQDPCSRSVFVIVFFMFLLLFCNSVLVFACLFVCFCFFFLFSFGPLWVLISGLKPKEAYYGTQIWGTLIQDRYLKKKQKLDFRWKRLTKGLHNHITLTKDLHKMTVKNTEWKYIVTSRTKVTYYITSYYMASSTSGQYAANSVFWLATRAGKMEWHCPPGTALFVPANKISPSSSGCTKGFFRRNFCLLR